MRALIVRVATAAGACLLLVSGSMTAAAVQINTGSDAGAYYRTFCPSLTKQLELLGKPSECLVSDGSAENIRRIGRNPDEFGYSQLDVYALETDRYGGSRTFEVVRKDDVRECVFAVTRNKSLTNFGEIAVNADRLRFVLPPKASGSAKTFDYLSKIDPSLGRASDISNANDTEEAIQQALSDENSVTFFVQFPDPDNPVFKLIKRLNGHIVPVIDSVILDQKVDGRSVYFAQVTQVEQMKWLKHLGKRVTTACTPLVLFTGASDRIKDRTQRAAHSQMVLSIRAMEHKSLVPAASPIAKVLDKTRQLSTRARDHFLELQELSLNARERARPFLDRIYRGAGHWVKVMIMKARPPEYFEGDRDRFSRDFNNDRDRDSFNNDRDRFN